ncbi:MAG: hypothetical protein ABW185_03270 [Sedimenticola sp.]
MADLSRMPPELATAFQSIEDNLREKYISVVRGLSLQELKSFNKCDYKRVIQSEIIELTDAVSDDIVENAAHYMSNALNNEAQRAYHAKSMTTDRPNVAANTRDQSPTMQLADTSVTDSQMEACMESQLDFTEREAPDVAIVEPPTIRCLDQLSDQAVGDGTIEDPSLILDDSITELKTVHQTKRRTSHRSGTSRSNSCSKPKSIRKKPAKAQSTVSTCVSDCKLKNTDTDVNQIRCNLCMSWFHEICVGIDGSFTDVWWLCGSCRNLPSSVVSLQATLQNLVVSLSQTTTSIVEQIQSLSNKFDMRFSDLKDQITSVSKQQKCMHDGATSQLEDISKGVVTLKRDVDNKTNVLANKTQNVLDKLKQTVPQSTLDTSNRNKSVRQPTVTVPVTQTISNTVTNVESHNSYPHVPSSSTTQSQPPKPKVTIYKTTLLVGSSILKGVRVSCLKKDTAVRTFPGATINSLSAELSNMNIEQCQTVILHVGGNDADEGISLDAFAEQYKALVDGLTVSARRLIVSGLVPRASVDLKPYDTRLKSLCATHGIEYVQNYDSFLFVSGELPSMYFLKDQLHLREHGTEKLLSNIENAHSILHTRPTESDSTTPENRSPWRYVVRSTRQRMERQPESEDVQHVSRGSTYRRYHKRDNIHKQESQRRELRKYCHLCRMNGHSTNECWFNGRSVRGGAAGGGPVANNSQ